LPIYFGSPCMATAWRAWTSGSGGGGRGSLSCPQPKTVVLTIRARASRTARKITFALLPVHPAQLRIPNLSHALPAATTKGFLRNDVFVSLRRNARRVAAAPADYVAPNGLARTQRSGGKRPMKRSCDANATFSSEGLPEGS